MKYWVGLLRDWGIAAIVVISAFATWQWVTTPTPLSEGPAPSFTLPNLEGGELSLADYGDQVVVLNFWFSDCGPCRAEIPELSAWSQANPDVPLVGVSTDRIPEPQLKTRVAQLGITYPVAWDQYADVAGAYQIGVFPTTVIVQGGEIRAVRMGALDRRGLEAMVQHAGG